MADRLKKRVRLGPVQADKDEIPLLGMGDLSDMGPIDIET